ncbi:heterokaryon incompatibility protein-domain-containing protein [Leptodontidium sp. 2 PMI_412]|nr:heterokaryon incompatibility protein-domain-containing protein [Leptodontidium sp. 2 PMI_412]
MASKHHYEPLASVDKSVRLVVLFPGSIDDDIEIRLIHTTIPNAPVHEALSYAWEEADYSQTVKIEGNTLAISRALHIALLHLRSHTEERVMWIDAICINQADINERNKQVSFMREIYASAKRVVIWIGPEQGESERAMGLLRKMGKEALKDVFDKDKLSRLQRWNSLGELLGRPWFSRAWVVQEVWMASGAILQCGNTHLRWGTFARAMTLKSTWGNIANAIDMVPCEEKRTELRRRYGLAIHISQRISTRVRLLFDMLWNTWDRESSDPRDKVFAILGLVKGYRDRIAVDYDKPMEVVFKEAASAIIKRENSLDLLLAACGPSRQDNLPSWVPDWRHTANAQRPILFVNRAKLHSIYDAFSVWFSQITLVLI